MISMKTPHIVHSKVDNLNITLGESLESED